MGSLLNVIIRSEECRKKKKNAHMATSMSHTRFDSRARSRAESTMSHGKITRASEACVKYPAWIETSGIRDGIGGGTPMPLLLLRSTIHVLR